MPCARSAPVAIITMGENGPRIHALLRTDRRTGPASCSMPRTISPTRCTRRVPRWRDEGVMLLSPGAPSFGPYRDYVARGRHFAELAGFDPDIDQHDPGIGHSLSA